MAGFSREQTPEGIIDMVKKLNVFGDSVSSNFDNHLNKMELCHKLISTLVDALTEKEEEEEEKRYMGIFKKHLVRFKENNNENNETRVKLLYIWRFYHVVIGILMGNTTMNDIHALIDGRDGPREENELVEHMFVLSSLNEKDKNDLGDFSEEDFSFFDFKCTINNYHPHLTQIPNFITHHLINYNTGANDVVDESQQISINISSLQDGLREFSFSVNRWINNVNGNKDKIYSNKTELQFLKTLLKKKNNKRLCVLLKVVNKLKSESQLEENALYKLEVKNNILTIEPKTEIYKVIGDIQPPPTNTPAPTFNVGEFAYVDQVHDYGKQIVQYAAALRGGNVIKDIIEELCSFEETPKVKLIIGYGASSSGKTSTLIHFNKSEDKKNTEEANGMVPEILRKILETYPAVEITIEKVCEFKSLNESPIQLEEQTGATKPESDLDSKLKGMLNFFVDTGGNVLRKVAFTPKNPHSSRYHVIAKIKISNNIQSNYLFVGDLAGIEGKFTADIDTLYKMYINSPNYKVDERKNDKITMEDVENIRCLEYETLERKPGSIFNDTYLKPLYNELYVPLNRDVKVENLFFSSNTPPLYRVDNLDIIKKFVSDYDSKFNGSEREWMDGSTWMGFGSFLYNSEVNNIKGNSVSIEDGGVIGTPNGFSFQYIINSKERKKYIIAILIRPNTSAFDKSVLGELNELLKSVTLKEFKPPDDKPQFSLYNDGGRLLNYGTIGISVKGSRKVAYDDNKISSKDISDYVNDENFKNLFNLFCAKRSSTYGFTIYFSVDEILYSDGTIHKSGLELEANEVKKNKTPRKRLLPNEAEVTRLKIRRNLIYKIKRLAEFIDNDVDGLSLNKRNEEGDIIRHSLKTLREEIVRFTSSEDVSYPNLDTACMRMDYTPFVDSESWKKTGKSAETKFDKNGIIGWTLNECRVSGSPSSSSNFIDVSKEEMDNLQIIILGLFNNTPVPKEKHNEEKKYMDINKYKQAYYRYKWKSKFIKQEDDPDAKLIDQFLISKLDDTTTDISESKGNDAGNIKIADDAGTRIAAIEKKINDINILNADTQLGVLDFLNHAISFFRRDGSCIDINKKN